MATGPRTKRRRSNDVVKWLQSRPSLDEMRVAYPDEWATVERELVDVVQRRDTAALEAYASRIAGRNEATLRPEATGGPKTAARLTAQIRREMAAAALRQHCIAVAAGVTKGKVRFDLLNGWVAQRLLFKKGLERKPASMRWFRLLWPALWQRRFLMPLVQPRGIHCFYSRPLIDALASLIGPRSCLEIGAGDGTLSRFLADRGLSVLATDDYSWKHTVTYPDWVVREDAREALRRRSPEVVICSWPPAANTFERHVFKTTSVELYIVISSKHEFASGDWIAYRQQTGFAIREAPELSRLVLPPEIEAAVYVFERREPSSTA